MERQTPHTRQLPLLLTPGPLTTAPQTRAAMQRDWGSRSSEFIALTAQVRARLKQLVTGAEDHDAVLLQGSGTYAVEAMLASMVKPDAGVLVLENGAYGRRMAEICRRLGRRHQLFSWPEGEAAPLAEIEAAIVRFTDLEFVAAIHVETTTGILNPLAEISALAARHGRRLLVDAMSSLGAMPIHADNVIFDAIASSANKCLEGVPGISFVLARKDALEAARGNAPSLSLDLHDQWRGFEATGEWRFTPPTQVLAALDAALDGLDAEGGVGARHGRYARNCAMLRDGLTELGLVPLLPKALQSPIIVTFLDPALPEWDFSRFYQGLLDRGFAIYPGKLSQRPSFRIGCIGQVHEADMQGLVQAVRETLGDMGLGEKLKAR